VKCKRPSKGQFSKEETKELHKLEMLSRRMKQFARVPDRDARVVYFSKNSLPEYRK